MTDFDEITEGLLQNAQLVRDLGFISLNSFEEFRLYVIDGFHRSEVPFLRGLALALEYGSLKDTVKIVSVWRNECSQYEMIERMFRAREEA